MQPDLWVVVDGSRYGKPDAFRANRARRVFAIVEAHVESGSITQFLVVGDDERFYSVFANDCTLHRIDDDKGAYIDLA
jgi:hypothetical protein